MTWQKWLSGYFVISGTVIAALSGSNIAATLAWKSCRQKWQNSFKFESPHLPKTHSFHWQLVQILSKTQKHTLWDCQKGYKCYRISMHPMDIVKNWAQWHVKRIVLVCTGSYWYCYLVTAKNDGAKHWAMRLRIFSKCVLSIESLHVRFEWINSPK